MRDRIGLESRDVLAFEKDLALVGGNETRYQAENGRLARTIGSDKAEDLSFIHLEGKVGNSLQAAEAFGKPLNIKQCHGLHPSSNEVF
jgi:hypothetical protein